jgi:HD-GYP domain-containing protein (c-di-GMP phosphodiesterase class II)
MDIVHTGLRRIDDESNCLKLEYFMPKPSNAKMQSLQHCGHLLWEYSYYVRQELRNPAIYLTSAVIGLPAVWMMNAPSMIPFLVPFIVQIAANAILRFRNRDVDTLLLLPGQREDPAFIMDHRGNVMMSAGKTEQLFKKNAITKITDLIETGDFNRLVNNLDYSCIDPETRSIDIYSGRLHNWYKIKFNPIVSHCGRLPEKLLVWFSEMTTQREAELRQRDLLHYTDSLMSDVKILARKQSTYDHLATFILNNYEGVFIARIDPEGNLSGYVFKRNGELRRSEAVAIAHDSYAPILLSRREATVIADDIRNYPSARSFDKKYMFDDRVRSFLNMPIRNFINYHAGDVSIIAFNSVRTLTVQENIFIEVLLNTTRAIVSLVDLARENDEQFLQKVMGLCAAAEYSDEITGRHILRVNAYSRLIAEELGFDLDFVENIGRVAALHDIGKVAIPELIKLARPFNREQRLEMQMHTIYGARIIETMMAYSEKEDPRMVMARNIALHHHQTFNGKGYPRLKLNNTIQEPVFKNYVQYQNHTALSGVEIPTEALIVGLADRYDALRSRRPYKEAYSHEKTLAVLTKDDRSGINGAEWYGEEIWSVFEKHHLCFKEVFEGMQN